MWGSYVPDSDNDLVSFSSDDELTEALGFVTDGVFRVYIRPDSEGCCTGVLHKGVVCDGCEKEVRGLRYKCVECADYDLCMKCEQEGKHNQHEMLRMCTPRQGGPSFPVSSQVRWPKNVSAGVRTMCHWYNRAVISYISILTSCTGDLGTHFPKLPPNAEAERSEPECSLSQTIEDVTLIIKATVESRPCMYMILLIVAAV